MWNVLLCSAMLYRHSRDGEKIFSLSLERERELRGPPYFEGTPLQFHFIISRVRERWRKGLLYYVYLNIYLSGFFVRLCLLASSCMEELEEFRIDMFFCCRQSVWEEEVRNDLFRKTFYFSLSLIFCYMLLCSHVSALPELSVNPD